MNTSTTHHTCPICEQKMAQVFEKKILNKYQITYFQCPACLLTQTEKPYWLEEAYSDAISEYDVGLLRRNQRFSELCTPIFDLLLGDTGSAVDVSGGYGVFTRIMRDRGFDFYTTDPYCENIFAKGFEPCEEFTADLFTLFEVIEHVENPWTFLKECVEKYHVKSFVVSTELFTEDTPTEQWWYLMPESGQHISFYHADTFQALAKKLGWHAVAIDKNLTLFHHQEIKGDLLDLCRMNQQGQRLQSEIMLNRKGKSLTQHDHNLLKNDCM